jgi:hypothetical protein
MYQHRGFFERVQYSLFSLQDAILFFGQLPKTALFMRVMGNKNAFRRRRQMVRRRFVVVTTCRHMPGLSLAAKGRNMWRHTGQLRTTRNVSCEMRNIVFRRATVPPVWSEPPQLSREEGVDSRVNAHMQGLANVEADCARCAGRCFGEGRIGRNVQAMGLWSR